MSEKRIHYAETDYGFEWGAVKIERGFSDDDKGWITLLLSTPKMSRSMQIYVTKTGKVRIFSDGREWLPQAAIAGEASGDKEGR